MICGLQLQAQVDDSITVLHLKVLDNIDPRTNRYTELGLEKAKELDVGVLQLLDVPDVHRAEKPT